MKISEAVIAKIKKLCDERKITINKLASSCGITQSTLENIVGGHSRNPKLLTIVRICDGLNITLHDFFNDPVFRHLERDD